MSQVAIAARVTVMEGKAEQYIAAFTPMLEQARKEPGTLLYAVHRSADDPHVFWTTEVYTDDDAFAAHRATVLGDDAASVRERSSRLFRAVASHDGFLRTSAVFARLEGFHRDTRNPRLGDRNRIGYDGKGRAAPDGGQVR